MARTYTCHTISAKWRGAHCNVDVLPGDEVFPSGSYPVEIRLLALMPDPLKLTRPEAEALAAAITATLAAAA